MGVICVVCFFVLVTDALSEGYHESSCHTCAGEDIHTLLD